MEEIMIYLQKNNIKPSVQRIEILKYLTSNNNHPTIDMIYKEIKKKIPTISRTTVYNTLKMFVKRKLIHIIAIEENVVRYDAQLKEHGHFKCEKCGAIHDVEIKIEDFKIESLGSYKINESHLYYRGICKNCMEG